MKFNKLLVFMALLIVGLTVVSAADVVSDDAVVTSDIQQVSDMNPQEEVTVQSTDNIVNTNKNLKQDDNTDPVSITTDTTITSANLNTYNNKNWTVSDGVTVTGSTGVSLSNVAIEIAGDYVTLDSLSIQSTNSANYIVSANGKSNLTIKNSALKITNTNDDTFGVYLKDTTNTKIYNTVFDVKAPSKSMNWDNYTVGEGDDAQTIWYSTPSVGAIVSDNSNNLNINNNTINISRNGNYNAGSTMPAIILRNQTRYSTVNDNTITVSGSTYNYGIMCNDNVNNLDITENRVNVTSEVYAAGIDASTSKNSNVNYNNITATSINTIGLSTGQEALAYGVILATTNDNNNNNVNYNKIDLIANVGYGIENYMGQNNHIEYNNISINAKRGLGIASNASSNNQYNNNKINITCNQETINDFYETIPAQNVGIIIISGNTNTINNNQINITETSTTTTTYAITLDENSISNTVNGNELYTYNTNTLTHYGTGAVNNLNIFNTISNNLPSTAPVQLNSNNKILKKEDNNVLIINSDNFSDYGEQTNLGITITLKNPDVSYITIDMTNIELNVQPKLTIEGVTASDPKIKILSNDTFIYQIFLWTDYDATLIDTYLPYCEMGDPCTIINSVIFYHKFPSRVTLVNSTILSLNENIVGVDDSTYNNYFDSTTNTISTSIKDESNILFRSYNATAKKYNNYNNPMIINKPVNIISYDHATYNADITFVAGSEGSNITGLTLNGNLYINTSNINVKNNTINKGVIIKDASGTVIEENTFNTEETAITLTGALESTIQNNNITTTSTYTITLDEDSIENTITSNNLQAAELTGIESILDNGEDNKITAGGDEPVTVETTLKVDTTEFTVGETTTITASIYKGDEIATDITGGKVVFKVNGVTIKDTNGKVIYAKLVNGQASITDYTIPDSWNKEGLTITAVYSGSSAQEALRSDAQEITVTKTTTPSITTTNITAAKGDTITLTATVTDGNNPITTGKVVFKVNGKTVKDANGKVIYANVQADGTVSVDYNIASSMKAKDYAITAVFTSAKYDKLTADATLTVSN